VNAGCKSFPRWLCLSDGTPYILKNCRVKEKRKGIRRNKSGTQIYRERVEAL